MRTEEQIRGRLLVLLDAAATNEERFMRAEDDGETDAAEWYALEAEAIATQIDILKWTLSND
jgi:hypothetical protein